MEICRDVYWYSVLILYVCLLIGDAAAHSKRHKKTKPHRPHRGAKQLGHKGLLDLYQVIECKTGCEPLFYNNYGCYCGLGGSGKPVDAIDRCCKAHDECYGRLPCNLSNYFMPYLYTCKVNDDFQCFVFNTHLLCAADLCHCDVVFANCLAKQVKKHGCPKKKKKCRR